MEAAEWTETVSSQKLAHAASSESPADKGPIFIPFLPTSGNEFGRDGFVRVINHTGRAGEVRVEAFDDEGMAYGPLTLAISANATAHFNARDLEAGNPAKGLAGSAGPGQGDWRLGLTSTLDIEALAYVRTPDGSLTAMHDVLPLVERGRRWVPFFNPGSNFNQVSVLRVVNPDAQTATVFVEGLDDRGHSPGSGVTIAVPPRAARSFTAEELESGIAPGLEGSLGDGAGKWRLALASDQPVAVMSLLSSPAGPLTNLSTAPVRGAGPPSSSELPGLNQRLPRGGHRGIRVVESILGSARCRGQGPCADGRRTGGRRVRDGRDRGARRRGLVRGRSGSRGGTGTYTLSLAEYEDDRGDDP